MRIYSLTQWGKKLARNTNAPSNLSWKIVYCLDRIHTGTADQIAGYVGASQQEVGNALGFLKRRGVVGEVGS